MRGQVAGEMCNIKEGRGRESTRLRKIICYGKIGVWRRGEAMGMERRRE